MPTKIVTTDRIGNEVTQVVSEDVAAVTARVNQAKRDGDPFLALTLHENQKAMTVRPSDVTSIEEE